MSEIAVWLESIQAFVVTMPRNRNEVWSRDFTVPWETATTRKSYFYQRLGVCESRNETARGRKSAALARLARVRLHGRVKNESVVTAATVHAWVLPNSVNGSTYASAFSSVATKVVLSNICGIFSLLDMHSICGTGSSSLSSPLVSLHAFSCTLLADK